MNYRKALAAAMAFLGGSYFFLYFVLPDEIKLEPIGTLNLQYYHGAISDGFIVVGVMTIGLGLISLLRNHGSRLLAKRQGWTNSLALLFGLFLMLGVCVADWRLDYKITGEAQKALILRDFASLIQADFVAEKTSAIKTQERATVLAKSVEALLSEQNSLMIEATADDSAKKDLNLQKATVKKLSSDFAQACAATSSCSEHAKKVEAALSEYSAFVRVTLENFNKLSVTKQLFRLLFEGIFISLGSAIFSLLGFYIVTAAFRAFRVRSFESGLMMLAALLVMLGQISVGILLWGELSEIRLWLLEYPNTAAFRAIDLGASVAGLILAFRMWWSIESKSFSGKD
jgi:hypothetical protein